MIGHCILSHGFESGPDATKVTALADAAERLGWTHERPDYTELDARREVSELAGVDALVPLLATLPALAVIWRVRLRERTWKRTLALRVALLAGMVGTAVLGVLPVTQPLTAFLRNQREVRYLVTPANVADYMAKN